MRDPRSAGRACGSAGCRLQPRQCRHGVPAHDDGAARQQAGGGGKRSADAGGVCPAEDWGVRGARGRQSPAYHGQTRLQARAQVSASGAGPSRGGSGGRFHPAGKHSRHPACMRVCACARAFVSVCASIYLHVHAYDSASMPACTHTLTHKHTHTHTNTRTHTISLSHTNKHVHTNSRR